MAGPRLALVLFIFYSLYKARHVRNGTQVRGMQALAGTAQKAHRAPPLGKSPKLQQLWLDLGNSRLLRYQPIGSVRKRN